MARASTDMGNVSQTLPAIHPYIGIDSLPAVNHQPEFAAATVTSAAETAIAHGALALAGTVVDAASQTDIRHRLLLGAFAPTESRCTTGANDCQDHPVRTEHDLLGDRDVPADVYYGVHTARALENFPISGVPISRHSDLVVALASVKQAAAEANQQLGQLDTDIAEAIVAACIEIRGGSLHDQFVVDEIQGGAGTSTNMNANEQLNAFEPIIARALLSSLGHLTAAVAVLGQRCIKGITANPERMRDAVLQSASIATALNPVLGYEAATALVAEAIATAASKPELVPRSALIDDAVLAHVLSPENLCRPDDPQSVLSVPARYRELSLSAKMPRAAAATARARAVERTDCSRAKTIGRPGRSSRMATVLTTPPS